MKVLMAVFTIRSRTFYKPGIMANSLNVTGCGNVRNYNKYLRNGTASGWSKVQNGFLKNETSPGIPDIMETYRQMMNNNTNDQSLNIFGDAPLTDAERRFLHAAESGNLKIIRQCFEENDKFNVNCVDILGRTALQLAVLQEHIDIIQYLLGRCKLEVIEDAFLHAIKNGFVRICELFLNHPVYSNTQQRKQLQFQHGFYDHEDNNSDFSPDITPIILAAHCNNFDIVFLLIQRGFYIQNPHHYFCTCTECKNHKEFDRVVHSRSRLNAYKGLASTSYMSLSSDDPIMTAFNLSQRLSHLANKEKEYKNEYKTLSDKCKVYAYDLLDLCRTESEVRAALHGDNDAKNLTRIRLAIKYEQKRFIAHASCQEHLMSMWYSDIPWFKHQSLWMKIIISPLLIAGLPLFAVIYFFAPSSRVGRILRIPVVKFLNYASSYVIFLILLLLATTMEETNNEPVFAKANAILLGIIGFYVLGMFWAEVKQLWEEGYYNYFADIWNLMDITMIALYTAAYTVWIIRDLKKTQDIYPDNPILSVIKPQVLANILFSLANVLTFARVAYLLPATEIFGQLQISYGRMIQDVLKFIAIYLTMMIAFICGLTSLYTEYEKQTPPKNETQLGNIQNKYFNSFVSTFNTLFWSTFGLGLSTAPKLVREGNDELTRGDSLTTSNQSVEVIGYLLYGVYIMFAVVVLINMLIAMMSNTFEEIRADEDVEWKYARAKLWLSYFDEGTTLPMPFNIIPTPKSIMKMLRRMRRICCAKTDENTEGETDSAKLKHKFCGDYKAIMRRVVMRYVHTMKLGKKTGGKEDLHDFKEEFSSQLESLHMKLDKKLSACSSTLHFIEAEILNMDKKLSKILFAQLQIGDEEAIEEGIVETNSEEVDEDASEFVFGINKNQYDPRETPYWNKGRFVKNPNKNYGRNWSKYEEASRTVVGSTNSSSTSDSVKNGAGRREHENHDNSDTDNCDQSVKKDGSLNSDSTTKRDLSSDLDHAPDDFNEMVTFCDFQHTPHIHDSQENDDDDLYIDSFHSGTFDNVRNNRVPFESQLPVHFTGSDVNLVSTIGFRRSPVGRLSDSTHDRRPITEIELNPRNFPDEEFLNPAQRDVDWYVNPAFSCN